MTCILWNPEYITTSLRASYYGTRRAVILQSALRIFKYRGQYYGTRYWKFWKTEPNNIALRTEHYISLYSIYEVQFYKKC